MKSPRASLALLVLVGAPLFAQPPTPPPAADTLEARPLRTPQELEELVAPIALYPDALIALILPASTAPADIVLAARYVRDHPNDRSQVEHRAWEESVKSLTHYPDVLKWMDENLQWTKQVGEAFGQQPADVMEAVQRLRAKARTAGTLVDTPQQQVIAEPEVIRIVPAQPNVIYVPYYEPEVVFVDRPVYYSRPFLTFGIGVPVGSWLAFDCDWRRRSIWHGSRHRHWSGHDWRHPVVPIASSHNHPSPHHPGVRQWRPPVQHTRPPFSVAYHARPAVVRPAPFGTATHRSYSPRQHDYPRSGPATSPPVTRTNTLRTVPSLPRAFTPDAQREPMGPHARPGSPSAAQTTTVLAPSQSTTPPAYSRSGAGHSPRAGGYSRHRDAGVASAPSPTVQPALPVVPSLPMAATVHSAPVTGPAVPRTFARPAAPMASAGTPNPAPVPHSGRIRGHSGSAHSGGNPAVVPALPTARMSATPAVVQPAPVGAPPQTAPAPAPARGGGDGGSRRGHNQHEH